MDRLIPQSDNADIIVDALLEGGPVDIPATARTLLVSAANAKVKIDRRGGYEHFERDIEADDAAGAPTVFHWTMRTEIAE